MSTEPSHEYQAGLWWEFLNALEDAKARSSHSPYGLRAVDDVACDPSRIAVSKEAERSSAFMRKTIRDLSDHQRRLQAAIDAFDETEDS